MFVLIFASFMGLLETTIVSVAVAAIRADIGATPSYLEWIVSGYTFAFAVEGGTCCGPWASR
ncbi:hypothetical protein [Nocardia colli]|uniref:hypothetical protein n=1 Tax=Nocardia colli TaxID=2545717 RepID=UPI0035E336DA